MTSESSGSKGGNVKRSGLLQHQSKEDMFEPIPYAIRMSNKWRKVGESSVLSPPDWLLLDHTIAVVWSLFSSLSPPKALDIEDLKWAHDYLKEVRNPKGDNPPDVKTCLTEIQDRLIAQYAQMTHSEGNPLKKSSPSPLCVTEAITTAKSVKDSAASEEIPREMGNAIEIQSTRNKNEKEPMKHATKVETHTVRKAATKEGTFARETKSVFTQQRRSLGLASKSAPNQTKRSEIVRKENLHKEDEGPSVENSFTEVFQRNKHNDRIPSSHILPRKKTNATAVRSTLSNEDISEPDVKKDSIQSHADDGKISLQFKKWITAEEMNNEEQAYKNLKNEIRNLAKNPKISKDEVLKFLSNWREEQVERLQSELRRLNSIEEFMKDFKMEGFVPYTPQNLIQKLESRTSKRKLNKPS